MAFRCVVVIRGISKPLVVDEMSSIAFTSGELPVALIPMFCALTDITKEHKRAMENRFFIFKQFRWLDIQFELTNAGLL